MTRPLWSKLFFTFLANINGFFSVQISTRGVDRWKSFLGLKIYDFVNEMNFRGRGKLWGKFQYINRILYSIGLLWVLSFLLYLPPWERWNIDGIKYTFTYLQNIWALWIVPPFTPIWLLNIDVKRGSPTAAPIRSSFLYLYLNFFSTA